MRDAAIAEAIAGYEGSLFYGQLHNQAASYGDDGVGTVAQNIGYMTGTSTPRLEFGGLSPHAHMLTSPDMLTYWSEMRALTNSTFVAVPGQEWSTLSTSGHCNVYLGNERCAAASGDIPGFYAWLNTSGGYGSFNHPWDTGGNSMNNWQYYPSVDKPGDYTGKMVMMEMKQTSGDATAFTDYLTALNNGWHIGMSVSDDNHLQNPGDKYANNPRTGMWLSSLTEPSIEKALQQLRFFGSQLEGGYIDLKAGNYTMGDVFQASNGTSLTAMLNPSFTYSAVDIYIDGTPYAMSMVDAGHYSYSIQAGAKHYYFVRARETLTNSYIISSPMWSVVGAASPPTSDPPAPPTNVTARLSGSDVTIQWDLSKDETMTTNQVSLAPSADAQVVRGYPTTNYGATTSLYVQSDSATAYLDERTWLRFDLGSVPAGATINSAKLQLYCWKATGANMDASCHPSNDDTWTEAGINWNNQPSYGGALETKTLALGATSVWYSWNVTSAAQNEFVGDKVVTTVVKPVTEGSATTKTYAFESKEYATTTLRPVLIVNYSSVSASGLHYEVFRGNAYSATGTGYSYMGQSASGTTTYTDIGAGDGDTSSHYYYVRAVKSTGDYANSTTQAGKFVRGLTAGWNMVSTPLKQSSGSLGTTLQTVGWTYCLAYNASNPANRWQTNYTGRPAFMDDLKSFDNKKAMWLNCTSADSMMTAGQVQTSTAINLFAGWNFVGYPARDDAAYSVGTLKAATGATIVEGYSAGATYKMQPLANAYVMKRGEGYWLYVPTDTVWTVNW